MDLLEGCRAQGPGLTQDRALFLAHLQHFLGMQKTTSLTHLHMGPLNGVGLPEVVTRMALTECLAHTHSKYSVNCSSYSD